MKTSQNQPNVLLGIPNVESGNALDGLLSAAGCRIDRAQTIAECETLLQKHEFELVVLDISLNGSEGIDAMSFCRRSNRLISGSSVVITSSDKPLTSDEVSRALSVGARDTVEMPVSAAKVEQLVRLAMEGRAVESSVAARQPLPAASGNG